MFTAHLLVSEIHWASKETYHLFMATLTQIHCTKINNIWAQISFNSSLIRISEKHKIISCQKDENAVKSRKVIFRKSQKLLTERALSECHEGSLFRTFNFNGGVRKRRIGFCLLRTPSPRGKQFLWFLTIDPLRFHRIYLLYDWSKLCFFRSAYWG